MTRYLISFNEGDMTISQEELPDVAKASMAVVEEARRAGVWVYGGGIVNDQMDVVGTDGSVTPGSLGADERQVGGFSVLDVGSREEALEWAARIAASCRCAQEVREIMPEPDL